MRRQSHGLLPISERECHRGIGNQHLRTKKIPSSSSSTILPKIHPIYPVAVPLFYQKPIHSTAARNTTLRYQRVVNSSSTSMKGGLGSSSSSSSNNNSNSKAAGHSNSMLSAERRMHMMKKKAAAKMAEKRKL
ncbi:unnamed protein product [Meganyctiphanes norvegica]|uniref:Uncharacterized protein n=1 Tax=Meganyctiphanes norvegica TaxID=48144 RepID=A0AAV2QDF8_MEGNR